MGWYTVYVDGCSHLQCGKDDSGLRLQQLVWSAEFQAYRHIMIGIAPVIYSAAGATVGIIQGAMHGAAVLLGTSDEPSPSDRKSSALAGAGERSEKDDFIESGSRPLDDSKHAEPKADVTSQSSQGASKKQPDGVKEPSQLNVNAPSFNAKPAAPVKQAHVHSSIQQNCTTSVFQSHKTGPSELSAQLTTSQLDRLWLHCIKELIIAITSLVFVVCLCA